MTRMHQTSCLPVGPVKCVFANLIALLLLLSNTAVMAMHFPRPTTDAARAAAERWESVHDFRERLEIPFNYTPVALRPEDCRYKTEQECQAADMIKIEHVEKQRRRAQGEVPDRPERPAAEEKEERVLVLLMRFTDHLERVLPSHAQFKTLWEVKIATWLEIQSYGKHTPSFDVLDWIDTDNSEEYYSFGDYGREDDFENSLFYLLNQLDADPEFDMSIYDADGDGEIDNLVVLHSGYNSETFDLDCQTQREPEFGIWSHWRYTPSGWESPTTGLAMNRYMVTSALDGNCGSVPATEGIMVMNYLHSLGLDSLYDQGTGIGNGLGKFDVMAYPYGNANDGRPGSLSSYSKLKVGWITPIEVTENSFVQLGPWGKQPDAIMITQKYSPGEYLLIENRQPVGVDDGFMGGGVAIYKVDEMQDGQSRASYPGKDTYPFDHYMVAVVPQDGKYDLEKGENLGDVGDLFQVGSTLGPGMNNEVFPNTDGYQFGYVWENGLNIHVKSRCGNPNAGRHLLVEITGFGDAAPTGNSECVVEENDSAAVDRPDRPNKPADNNGNGSGNGNSNGNGNGNGGPPDAPGPGINAATEAPTETSDAGVATMAPTESNHFGQADVTAVPTNPDEEVVDNTEEIVTMSPTTQLTTNDGVDTEIGTISPTAGVTRDNAVTEVPEGNADPRDPIATAAPTESPVDAAEEAGDESTSAPTAVVEEDITSNTPPGNTGELPDRSEPGSIVSEAPADPASPEINDEHDIETASAQVVEIDSTTATDGGYDEGGTIAAPERDESTTGADSLLVIPTGDNVETAPAAHSPPTLVDEISVLDAEPSASSANTDTTTTRSGAAGRGFHLGITVMLGCLLIL